METVSAAETYLIYLSKLEVPVNCITEHPGYDGKCSNVCLLQTDYFQYDTTTSSLHCMNMYKLVYVSVYFLLTSYFYFTSGNTDIQHTDS